jgi:hypothetical protein
MAKTAHNAGGALAEPIADLVAALTERHPLFETVKPMLTTDDGAIASRPEGDVRRVKYQDFRATPLTHAEGAAGAIDDSAGALTVNQIAVTGRTNGPREPRKRDPP